MTKIEKLRQERDKWGDAARTTSRLSSEMIRKANEAEKEYLKALEEKNNEITSRKATQT